MVSQINNREGTEMDYSKLSDFEINVKVAEIVVDYDCISRLPQVGMSVYWGDGANWHLFNPCNNPADAWPIIVDNNISLHAPRYKEGWMAEFTGSDDDVNDGFSVEYFDSHHANPLRAAMIVFLMMQ